MRIGVDSNAFPAARRVRTWRDVLCEAYTGLDCQTSGDDFRAVIEGYRVGDYSITRGTSSGHYVDRRAEFIKRDGAERLFFGLVLEGRAAMIQAGREAILAPGIIAFQDATRPFRTYVGAASDVIWLGVPKRPLADRVPALEDMTSRVFAPSRPVHTIAFDVLAGLDAAQRASHETDALVVHLLDLLALTIVTSALTPGSKAGPWRSLRH